MQHFLVVASLALVVLAFADFLLFVLVVAFFVTMFVFLSVLGDGLAAIIRPAEPPASDAQSGVSA